MLKNHIIKPARKLNCRYSPPFQALAKNGFNATRQQFQSRNDNAYGDSRGDREMIEFADIGTYVKPGKGDKRRE